MSNASQRPLPEGWGWVRLGEACEINPRRPDLKRADEAPTTFVPMSAVEEAGRGVARAEHKPFCELRKGYTFFGEGDVLFAKITPCMQNGKHAIARNLIDGVGFGSTEFHVLRPKRQIMSEWVHQFILQPRVLQEATAYFSGAVGQQRVPKNYLAGLAIPLPPLPEQQRIVAILSQQMAAVEQARSAAKARLEAAKALPAAYLRAVFDSPEAQQWPRTTLKEIGSLTDGDWILNSDYSADGVRLLQVGDVGIRTFIGKSQRFITMERAKELGCTLLAPGDILISRMPDPIGRACLLPDVGYPSITAVDVTIWRPRTDMGDRQFLVLCLNTEDWFKRVADLASGATRQRISRLNLESMELPVPSLADQCRIASELSERLVGVDRARKALDEELDMVSKLPASLLRRAFAGGL